MFKVVADQLKVSQGWVRCGQCSEVFDASLHLQQPEAPAQVAAPAPSVQAPSYHNPPLPAPAFVPVSPEPADSGWSDSRAASPGAPGYLPAEAEAPAGADFGADSSGFDPSGWKRQFNAPALDESGRLRLGEAGEAVRTGPDSVAPPSAAASPRHEEAQDSMADAHDALIDALGDEDGELQKEAPHDVSFVRDARRRAFWRRPAVRAGLGLLSLLLVALLLLQVALQQRDSLAAQRPELRPALLALCARLHCEIAPLRRIDAIAIDSSTFNRIGADAYRLSFSLKNAGAAPLAMPSLEVTLTDTQEQALVRRVLTPAQFGAAGALLQPGADFSAAVAMKVAAADSTGGSSATPAASGPLRVAGYRVLAFYP